MSELLMERPCWFLGACFGGNDDQTQRFISEGIWENGYTDRYIELVKEIRPGDRVAIKAAHTQSNNLPFENRGHSVSAMTIKATGTVTENPGDGRRLKVSWRPLAEPRRWFFFTYLQTVWKVLPESEDKRQLIDFTFEGKPQNIDRFRNEPFWRERFGDQQAVEQFAWTRFYSEFANKLLKFRHDRTPLIQEIHRIAKDSPALSHLQDKFPDGSTGPLADICPFTVLGLFNRGIKRSNRIDIASKLGVFLGLEERVPQTFLGIPVLHNMKSWLFIYAKDRKPEDIEEMWQVFAAAIAYADEGGVEAMEAFRRTFDKALTHKGVSWNLTCGLYWVRAWDYPSLDQVSREYIEKEISKKLSLNVTKKSLESGNYLDLIEKFRNVFEDPQSPVHSFPSMSYEAWRSQSDDAIVELSPEPENDGTSTGHEVIEVATYSIDNIVEDGCFLSKGDLEEILHCLRLKKNLILQGPPGTGKTWLARRLGFALMGSRDESRLRAVQFHPNLSYEDFVRGWRPGKDARLELLEGAFMEIVETARKKPELPYLLLIEEINRGNPAQIFGEMLTLLEADKRHPDDALELSYKRFPGEKVYVPSNLYVIGTMNVADRSLALVDLALRRRFAFIELAPQLGEPWKSWVSKCHGIELALLNNIEHRLMILNEMISGDMSLGRQFRVGHSYVTPGRSVKITDGKRWFSGVVETEIGPLMDEYWFDSPEKAKEARRILTDGF